MTKDHPQWIFFFVRILPLTALLTGLLSRGKGHESPWKYWYSALIYIASVPGIFAVTLSIYLFLFERRNIMQTNIYTQVLPVLAMIATLIIIRKNVNLNSIPGFDRMSGLVTMIVAALMIMWFIDRTHIIAISFIPFHYVILLFAVLLFVIRFAWKRVLGGS